MKVTLAVEYDGKKPDATIDVEDHVGKQLIAVGNARAVESAPTAETKAANKVAEEVAKKAAEAEAHAYAVTEPGSTNTETA